MAGDLRLGDVKGLLQQQIEGLCRELLPDGWRSGRYWFARNPRREDRKAGSFFVWLRGAPGAWTDKATGEQGDVISLIILVKGLGAIKGDGQAIREALAWARGWLGVERMAPGEIEQAREAAAKRAATAAAIDRQQSDEKRRKAFGWWLHCDARIAGTPVEAYLASRGIRLDLLGRMPRAIRYAPRLEHRPSETAWPGMMALMTDSHGIGAAIHRTFLALDGTAKAPVEPSRMMWGETKGSAIRLWRGETQLGPEEAARHGLIDTLALVEGIEDGLSLALACPELRIWAAGSLGNLGEIRIPDCADEVIVCADNDWGKPETQAALDRAISALARQGKRVRVARAAVGKDFNDQLRGVA